MEMFYTMKSLLKDEIELNGKRILMEVTKDYAKKNEGVYYYLANDLTDEEKLLFKEAGFMNICIPNVFIKKLKSMGFLKEE